MSVKICRQRLPFTWEQHQQILARMAIPTHNLWREDWPDVCVLAWHLGLRLGDICVLPWSALNPADKTLTVYPQKRRAAKQRLIIPMTNEVIDVLIRRKADLDCDPESVFRRMCLDYRTAPKNISHQFCNAIKDLGFGQGYCFHSYRHSFVTRLLNAGVDHIIIGSLTGQSPGVIASYSHPSLEAKAAALEAARCQPQEAAV